MKQQRAPFQSLDADLDDKVEQLAQEKGVRALVKPATPPVAGPSSESDAVVPAQPAARMRNVNVELPDYLTTALKIRAAELQTTVRHIVMAALRRDGFVIHETDMIDANLRTRGAGERARRIRG
jgi:hypothetical protein